MSSVQFGVIGGGVMGEALISRLLRCQLYAPEQVLVSDRAADRCQLLQQQYGVRTTLDNRAVVAANPSVLLLAIKPQILDQVAVEITDCLTQQQPPFSLIISILAGVTLSHLETAFPQYPVIRAMPNTPAIVGAGITAITANALVTPEQLTQAQQIFGAVGEVVELPESAMDAVTALSGSGPGYVAIVIEALADGGVAAGLARPVALQLTLKTVQGTAELLQTTGMHPAQLKDRVTSPGGTTIAGIAQLEQQGLRSALIEAVQAAYRRSRELGKS
ncbi:pyrroline-5-carboxylate reductase [Trichothermofontia sichuanensis B231]|uniref:pyrroline-5-carboxylate reductase n=1 Tax=Trichothermofontia sichuanensis TaxID=3045816 RepID=UPI0022471E7E|nr:pyrroline-5-carboxylate reductase [Trichothermofontia sichuanensis]UZQ52986.1 pyrroline-5-carboxylate reductase [Trichothermofontia sichuanensis B231]